MRNKFNVFIFLSILIFLLVFVFNIQKDISVTKQLAFKNLTKTELMNLIMTNILEHNGIITSFQYKNGIIQFKSEHVSYCSIEILEMNGKLDLKFTTMMKTPWYKSTHELDEPARKVESVITKKININIVNKNNV